jgi:cellulose synthase/poly-beta-1,6-N-acetylglucosamine synthase-like glycosyltransferase
MVLLILNVVLLALYRMIIGRANRILMLLPYYQSASLSSDKATVIIPARNEATNIGRCLDSLLQQSLPSKQFEIIVVDDVSSDTTASIVMSYAEKGVKLLQLTNEFGGKKAALSKGIAAATHPIIVTTDADCTYPKNWLNTLLTYRSEQDAVFIAAPVKYTKENNFLERFQSLDFLALQGITIAAVSKQLFNMCNGANLLYTKAAFEKVNGFEGIDKIPTGDDMLLMEKMQAAFPGQIKYCFSKDVIVETLPAKGLRAFIQQRIRWASKSTSYKNKNIKLVLLLVYLVNLSIMMMLIGGFYDLQYLRWGLLFILIKTIFEYPFMIRTARFFGKQNLLPWFIIAQPLHIVYIVLSASLSFFKRYEWKGRLTVGG